MKKYVMLAVSIAFLCSCTVVPVSVRRPWNRTLAEENIPAGSSIAIEVRSISTPLLGTESLVEKEIADKAASLLARRGYQITDQNYQYKLNIYYKTEQQSKSSTSLSSYNKTSVSYPYVRYQGGGYGVNLAHSIAASIASSEPYTETSTVSYDLFYHTIACEFSNLFDRVVWNYVTTTESLNKDLLRVYAPLLQMAFSSLPTDENIYPRVPKLNPDRFDDFSNVYILGNYYICPALPHLILFWNRHNLDSVYGRSLRDTASSLSRNREATFAYLDLLETAEYAIPACKEKHWDDPTDKIIWRKVNLIGKYYLGNDPQPVNIIIELSGTPKNYAVTNCRIADESEFELYQTKYNKWVQKLTEFYDFYQEDSQP